MVLLCRIQQFAASGVPLPVGGQYVYVQPGGSPVLYVGRADGEKPEEGGSGGGGNEGYIEQIFNFVTGLVPANPIAGLIPGGNSTKTPEAKPTEEKEKEKVHRYHCLIPGL